MILALVLAAVGVVLGVGFLAIGWNGKRIDDHPVCRKCGFDLFGLPPGVHVCAECGAGVWKPGTVRRGHRRKIRWLVASGSSLLLFGAVFFGLTGWVVFKGIDINEYKPVWLLLREATGSDVPTRDAALKELFGRVSSGSLTDAKVNMIMDRALEVQADVNRPWATAWGDLVERAHAMKKLSPERWKRYIAQAPQVKFEVRPRVRKGAPLPIRRDYTARVGKNSQMFIRRQGMGTLVDGIRGNDRHGRGLELAVLSEKGDPLVSLIEASHPSMAKLTLGTHTVNWPLELWMYDVAPTQFSDTGSSLARLRRDVEARFELVDGETVELLNRPDLKDSIAAAIITKLRRSTDDEVSGFIHFGSPPAPLGFQVFIRDGKNEWKAGQFASGGGVKYAILSAKTPCPAKAFDVILRSSREAAEEMVDLTKIWEGEIVIRDVTVEFPVP